MPNENNTIPPATNHAAAPRDLAADLAACEAKRDEYLAGWQRAKADFINYKKDELVRLEEVARYGNEELLRDLLTVLDNFDLSLRALEKSGPVEKGVYLIRTQLSDILTRRGLEKITIKPGDPFDPAIAEAIAEADGEPPGSIVDEIEAGYRLNGKIIRPARVRVARAKSH